MLFTGVSSLDLGRSSERPFFFCAAVDRRSTAKNDAFPFLKWHDQRMADVDHTPASSRQMPLWLGGVGALCLLTAAVFLWAGNGAGVFFDMAVAGIMSCF